MSLTEVNAFIDEIERTLSPLVMPTLTTASAPPKLFEAYILMLILQAAGNEGANITYEDVTGNPTNRFVFRGGPGYLYSSTQNYTHAIIAFPGRRELEAHINVRVAGKSKVLHECDVAIIDRAEAITCRQNSVMPHSSKLLLAIECKYYEESLPLGLGRAFIGLVKDISSKHSEIYFVTNTSHNPIQSLLAHHKEKWQIEIRPTNINNISRIKALFQEAFKNFKQRG